MPDVFQDRSPGSDTDTGSDQNSNLIVENVLGRCSVWSIDLQCWHPRAVLYCNLVHSHWVKVGVLAVVGDSQDLGELLGEITDLTDMHGNVRVRGTGRDGEWMPLESRDRGNLEEKPLTGLIFHRRLSELDLHGICKTMLALEIEASGPGTYCMGA